MDTVNNEKRTALHLAVLNRKPDIVATLVKVTSLELQANVREDFTITENVPG